MIPKASLILKTCLVTVAVAVASCSTVPERAPASTPSVALFKGVSHQTLPATGPVPMAIHVLRIDLAAPGVSLVVTPGDPSKGHEYRALKTSEALRLRGDRPGAMTTSPNLARGRMYRELRSTTGALCPRSNRTSTGASMPSSVSGARLRW